MFIVSHLLSSQPIDFGAWAADDVDPEKSNTSHKIQEAELDD